jgi:hypothetical protein
MSKLSPKQTEALAYIKAFLERNPRYKDKPLEFDTQAGWWDHTAPGSSLKVAAATMKALLNKGLIKEVGRRENTSQPTTRNPFTREMGWSKVRTFIKFKLVEVEAE